MASSAGILPRMKISIVLFHIKKFMSYMLATLLLKKTSTCRSQVGHIKWLVGNLP